MGMGISVRGRHTVVPGAGQQVARGVAPHRALSRRTGRCRAPVWGARRRVGRSSRHLTDLSSQSTLPHGEEQGIRRVAHERCCGLDLHKTFVVACRLATESDGTVHQEVRTYSARTNDLVALADWVRAEDCGPVVMESTGS
jgi:hypothetical protein